MDQELLSLILIFRKHIVCPKVNVEKHSLVGPVRIVGEARGLQILTFLLSLPTSMLALILPYEVQK